MNLKTPISYYGGKQRMLSVILSKIPDHKLYCEPFLGGAAVFFGKPQSDVEVINDTNKELMNFYSVCKEKFSELNQLIKVTLHSRKAHQDAHIIYANPHLFSDVQRAWAIWVLSSQSFSAKLNGNWGYDIKERTSTKRISNKRENFSDALADRLKDAQIESADALYIIQSRDSADSFFYCDPPYFNSHCGHYGDYGEEDFEKLLQSLSKIKGKFLLSSYPSEVLTKFVKAKKWHQLKFESAVSVNAKGRNQKRKVEVLTANYPLDKKFISKRSIPTHNIEGKSIDAAKTKTELVNKVDHEDKPITMKADKKKAVKAESENSLLQLMSIFANLDGKQKSVSVLRSLNNKLNEFSDREPLVSEMFSRLRNVLNIAKKNSHTHVDIKLEKAFKRKIAKRVHELKPDTKSQLSGVPDAKTHKAAEPGGRRFKEDSSKHDDLFQNIDSIDQHTKDTFRLKNALGVFLGDLETYKLAMSIEGDQGAGKTQLAFQLADGFADLGYNVGMFQLEIGANSNIVKRNRDKYILPANRDQVQIAGEAPAGIKTVRQYAQRFKVIIIDSWTKLDVDSQEFDNLRNDFPDTIWIVLFQRTSANKIRGGTKPLYDAGINIEVAKVDDSFVNNYAVATKNRYGETGIRFNISSKEIVS